MAPSSTPPAPETAPRRILVFGDSNSWGYIPRSDDLPSERFPKARQWPFVMEAALGPGHEIVVDALSGRTTDHPDPQLVKLTGAGLDGSAALPAVVGAHLPLDLVVIMLGTNDTKAAFARSAFRIALGAGRLVDIVQSSGQMFGGGWYAYPAPRVLLVAPPPLARTMTPNMAEEFAGGYERSIGLAAAYRAVAEAAGAAFFDAGSVIGTDGVDGVHFTAETQHRLGTALAEAVRAALG
ncbi:GDSL-type esterase/lipase family protein [Labrys wisconsinensis]|uniref:Lysophospholipase L1-like esterase n=1 Tax=Labrys wisconsinensis TaxID=425677 RepID=A0ABU0JDM2_9HYPH|nr:GDSL-type esterase/lipase family protein [Labrys wisconsinensis]MDQ0472385.1 lysophospholipase L1-like esterase [Labrys wisconsinensis]